MNDNRVKGGGGLTIAHLNVASIFGASKFELMRQQLTMSKLNVLCLSMTWLNGYVHDDLVEVERYSLARWDRNWAEEGRGLNPRVKKGGGLLCYVSQSYVMDKFKFAELNLTGKDLEMQCVLLDMEHMRNIVIINIYRPPQGDYKRACRLIGQALNKADLKDNVEVYLLGDYNIDINDRKSPLVKELEATTSFWGLKALIHEDTRLGLREGVLKGTCIDNIFSNSDVIMEAGVLNWNISDHLVVTVKRKRPKTKQVKRVFRGRSYRNYVKEDLQEEVIRAEWGEFYEGRDPSKGWSYIESLVREFLNRSCPEKEYRVKEDYQ